MDISHPVSNSMSANYGSVSRTVHLNEDTGQWEVSIGDTRYEVIPGSVAEQDIFLAGHRQPAQPPASGQCSVQIQPASSAVQSTADNRSSASAGRRSTAAAAGPSQVQLIIGARLGLGRGQTATYISKKVVKAESTRDRFRSGGGNSSPFKKPAIPVRFQHHDFSQIVSNIATVFSDDEIDEREHEILVENRAEGEERRTRHSQLPRKKRFSTNPKKAIGDYRDSGCAQGFQCVICQVVILDQKSFYFHLKTHYEATDEEQGSESESTNIQTRSGRISRPSQKVAKNLLLLGNDEINTSESQRKRTSSLEPSKHYKNRSKGVKNFNLKKSNLKNSQRRSSAKTVDVFKCNECNAKPFATKNALTVHKRIHTDERPFKCETCQKSFRQFSDLGYHNQSMHSCQKEFQCEYCGKEFSRKYSLTIHRKIHTGVKDHVCEFCQKAFRAAVYLQCHRRIHTGERPYPCDVCRRAFRVRADMTRHKMHVHQRLPNSKKRRVQTPAAEPQAAKKGIASKEPSSLSEALGSEIEVVVVSNVNSTLLHSGY